MKTQPYPVSKPDNQPLFKMTASGSRMAGPPALAPSRILAGFILEEEDALRVKDKLTRLTSREIEVLQRIADGNANKETAWKLGIHIKTVQKHREHLMQKLNIHNTAGLTRYAICAGILENSVQLVTA